MQEHPLFRETPVRPPAVPETALRRRSPLLHRTPRRNGGGSRAQSETLRGRAPFSNSDGTRGPFSRRRGKIRRFRRPTFQRNRMAGQEEVLKKIFIIL